MGSRPQGGNHDKTRQASLASSIFSNMIGVSSRTNRKANKSHAESYPYVKQALPQSQAHFILRSEWNLLNKVVRSRSFNFFKIPDRFKFTDRSLLPSTSYHDMGRRAKHHTAADKALAAKAYNAKYRQSPM
jgi:hypothetical protein